MEAGAEGLGVSVKKPEAYFYADNKLVASTKPERLQRDFDVLADLFYWVGLQTNMRKTVSMEFQP